MMTSAATNSENSPVADPSSTTKNADNREARSSLSPDPAASEGKSKDDQSGLYASLQKPSGARVNAVDNTELDEFGLPIRPRRGNTTRVENLTLPDEPEPVPRAPESKPSEAENNAKELSKEESPKNETGEIIYKDPPQNIPDATSSDPLPQKSEDATDAPQPSQSTALQKGNPNVSQWSHQRLASQGGEGDSGSEDELTWQDMPALGSFDVYDDYGRVVARGAAEEDDEAVYRGLGGAGKGYTRVQLDEDAQSATSMDDDTRYLFKEGSGNALAAEEEEQRDPLAQLQATKDLLTEGQRIAYVGVTRLTIYQMVTWLESIQHTKGTKKILQAALESMTKWGQQMMVRLYAHMDIDPAEQVMIEQLAEHGVLPADLVPPLMQNARVKNPLADETASPRPSASSTGTPDLRDEKSRSSVSLASEKSTPCTPPPPYEEQENGEELPEARIPSQMPTSDKIDLDLRWTVLCDLFLVLVADSAYDARSRLLLEKVGEALDISWIQICRFEKRVMDALEMQDAADKETWDEAEHMETRRKQALKKKYMIMGLATVGGGLVIGLSAGLMAPVIGAGLAAGFTTIGVSGTSAFLGGVGGTALIASGATITGSTIGVRASHRRTGAVKTFEYRPLHNNKRVNLILTVAGWMNGKVDDVRLPYSTVDPIMGDIYSILWEPEMLRSMGDTINILATEALTQGLQQVLGSTILVALMASLQLPIVLTKLSYLIDNPWTVSLGRADAAGLILADSLMDRNLGNRPITLLGFSLGAKLIFSCLKELANKGAYGLVQNVYLFGSPIVAKKDEYLKARSVVSGRFVNGYASNDWILGYLFRATSGGIMRVAGLAPVEDIPGLENVDVTELVNGHMAYRAAMPRLLREVGWEVESDEFTEIEDPDPDNHQERQRELIREIDDARRKAEEKPEKKRFGLFKRGKLAEKKGWETYEADWKDTKSPSSTDDLNSNSNVLFDIDAIRAELASEQMEVKQLESTLPPMKLDLNSPSIQTEGDSSVKNSIESPAPTKSPNASSTSRGTPVPSTEEPPPDTQVQISQPGKAKVSGVEQEDWPTSPKRVEADHRHSSSTSPYLTASPLSHSASTSTIPLAGHDSPSSPAARPGLLSSATMPVTSGAGGASTFSPVSLEHNAWADDEFNVGHEQEIKMSFE
ncbi:hypothetical protein FQN54_001095 [Arachnomyces sp. PD_36]|nr:hypothetical protein FQN54_001095 [Arachnomyces sp. PD_36]